jgi:hypothetical protein
VFEISCLEKDRLMDNGQNNIKLYSFEVQILLQVRALYTTWAKQYNRAGVHKFRAPGCCDG